MTVMDAPRMPAALLPAPDEPDPLSLLVGELKRQLETKRDLLADTRLVSLACSTDEMLLKPDPSRSSFPPDPVVGEPLALLLDMAGAVDAYRVTRHAHGQIASHLGVGWTLYDRLLHGLPGDGKRKKTRRPHPDLLAALVNGLLAREPSTRMLRTMDGKVRAFLSNAYRPRDNWDLLEHAILPELATHPGVAVRSATLTDTNLYLKVALPHALPVGPPAVGDVLHAGLIVRNSEVGAGALLAAPYTTVLSCLNGQTHTEYGKRQRHVGGRLTNQDAEAWELYSDATLRLDDDAFFSKVRDVVRAALSAEVFDLIVRDMNALVGMPVTAPPMAAVEVLGKQLGCPEGERDSIMRHLIEGGNLSAYGYVNSVTAMARDLPDADRQAELEQQAGVLIAKPETWVPRLNTVRVEVA